ncbi:MAG: hypothetical protein AB8C84_06365 [Oligoflexales bacterium]
MHSVTGFYSVLQWLLSPYFVGAWCLMLALLASIQIWSLIRALRPFAVSLRTFAIAVQSSGVEDIEKVAGNHPILAGAWRSYSRGLCEQEHSVWIALRESKSFLTADKTYEILSSTRTRESASGMLSSLGILGTFVGLSSGVWVAQTYFDGDAQHIQYGLSQLLAGAGLAFLTSLTGLFCSIVYARIERFCVEDLDNLLAHTSSLLDLRFPVQMWEQSLIEQLTVVEEQQKILENISSELHLSRRQDMTWHSQCLKSLVKAFQEELHGSTQEHLETMVLSLDESVQKIMSLNQHLFSLGENWEVGVERQKSDIQMKFDELQASVTEPLSLFANQFSHHLNAVIDEAVKNLSIETLSTQCEDMEVSLKSFTNALQLFAGDLQIMRAECMSLDSEDKLPEESKNDYVTSQSKPERRRRFGVQKVIGARA